MLDILPEDWDRPDEPPMPVWAGTLWKAWSDLDSSRPMITAGMGGVLPGRIPWSVLDRWAERHGIEGDHFDFFVRCLAVMDSILIERTNKRETHDR